MKIRSANFLRWKRYLSLRFPFSRIKEKGIFWGVCRMLEVLKLDLSLVVRSILSKLWNIRDNVQYRNKKQPDVLYAFYDLEVSAPTFDIVAFLALAEIERKKIGCDSLHTVIVPGSNKGFHRKYIEEYLQFGTLNSAVDRLSWRVRNLLVPCCWLIPSCRKVTVCASREEAQAFQSSLVRHIFPKGYTVRFPKKYYSFDLMLAAASQGAPLSPVRATPQALRYVSDWIQSNTNGRKAVTITLRECMCRRDRNSNLKAWGQFARGLDHDIYCPVIVRDIEAVFRPLPAELEGLTIFSEPCWNIELRAALYELSYLNLFVINGPLALCQYNRRTRYLVFKIITPSCSETTEQYIRSSGLEPGSQLKYATAFQKWIWEDDKLEVIQEAFKEMCDKIEGVPQKPPMHLVAEMG